MTRLFLILSAAFLFSHCTPRPSYYQQARPDYTAKYADQREPGSKLVSAWYHYTIEQLPSGEYVKKDFYPDTKQLTHFTTFSDKDLKNKHGKFKVNWDDGSPSMEGNYAGNKKHGEWVVHHRSSRTIEQYSMGDKTGTWLTYDTSEVLIAEYRYAADKKNGLFKVWDSEGQIKKEGEYKEDELVWEKDHQADTTAKKEDFQPVEVQPYFIGAACQDMEDDEKKKCNERAMLTFIYSNIKYPAKCRELGIDGMALVEFVVEKDGSINEVRSRRGICKEIKDECLRVVNMMPNWTPGYQQGKPVRVQFTLPVRFKLE